MSKVLCKHCSSDNLDLLHGYPSLRTGERVIVEHYICCDCGAEGSVDAIKTETGWRSALGPSAQEAPAPKKEYPLVVYPNKHLATVIDLTQEYTRTESLSFVSLMAKWSLSDMEWHPLTEMLVLSKGPYMVVSRSGGRGLCVQVQKCEQTGYTRSYNVKVTYYMNGRGPVRGFNCYASELRARIDKECEGVLLDAKRLYPKEFAELA